MNRIKYIVGSIAGLGGLLIAGLAHGAGTIITLPEGFVASALAYVGDLFTDLNTLILLVIGLPLGFWVIRKVVSLVRAR